MGEIIRFGIVGVAATGLQYLIYWILIHWIGPSASMTIGYAISFVFNFIASTHYTFKVKASPKHGLGFAFSHLINYLLQIVTLNLFLYLGVSKQLAPVPMFCVCVPVNFLLVRFFLKR
jgi:putative flippase GtrA